MPIQYPFIILIYLHPDIIILVIAIAIIQINFDTILGGIDFCTRLTGHRSGIVS